MSLRLLVSNPVSVYTAGHILAYDGKTPVSWSRFCTRVAQWQAVLAGVDETCIALYQRDGLEFLAALVAVWRLGKYALLPANNLPATVKQLQQRGYCFAGEFPGTNCIVPGNEASSLLEQIPVAMHTRALVLFTSGSSGAPEPVVKSFAQLEAELEALERFRGAQLARAVITGSVSHQHIYGLLFRLLWPLVSGRAFISRERDYWEELSVDADEHTWLAIVTSPAHLNRLPPIGFRALPCVVFSSGAPLARPAALAASEHLGLAITEVYGSTETGGIGWREQVTDESWHCLPGVSISIDEASGLLQVKSPHLPDAEWFISADKARMDGAGFQLLGRVDRIAKVAGKRISLMAVEQLIAQRTWVQEVRIIVLPERGDRLGAVVVLTEDGRKFVHDHGKNALNEHLKRGLDRSLERIAIPRYWRYPVALPLNAQGKVTQAALHSLFEDDTAGDGVSALPIIVTRDEQDSRLQLTLTIPANLRYFDGHFPGNPVLPGIVQTHWAMHYAREYWGDLGEFAGLEAVKFQQLIVPATRLQLELEYPPGKGKLYFSYRTESGTANPATFSSGRILLSNET